MNLRRNILRALGGVAALAATFLTAPQVFAQQTVCDPMVFVSSPTCIGDAVTLTLGGHLDCRGCLMGSLEPGPTQFGPLSIPLEGPALFFAALGGTSRTLVIPNEPYLVGATFYFATIITDGNVVEVSPGLSIVICP